MRRPRVALVSSVPVVVAALEEAIDFADVLPFTLNGGDVADLLRQVHPDAIVVDDAVAAEAATSYALEADLPLLYLALHEQVLRVLRPSGWEDATNGADPDAGTVRNALAGALFGAEVSAR